TDRHFGRRPALCRKRLSRTETLGRDHAQGHSRSPRRDAQAAVMRPLPDILYNFHWIVPGEAARSAQAYAGFPGPFLKSHDIATLINLRGANPHWGWWRYETRVCRQID